MPKDIDILSMTNLCVWEMVCPNPCNCLCKFKSPSSLVFPLKMTSGDGRTYRISNGENPIIDLGEHLTIKRATGNMPSHGILVSWYSLVRVV